MQMMKLTQQVKRTEFRLNLELDSILTEFVDDGQRKLEIVQVYQLVIHYEIIFNSQD